MLSNWAGNVRFRARAVRGPTSLQQLRQVIAANDQLRVLGTGHSFNAIVDTPGELISMSRWPARLDIDSVAMVARIGAGMTYADIVVDLDRAGFALANMGSLPHVNVAGACSTGTHGSGVRNQCLAGAVEGVTLVTADGAKRSIRRGDDEFDGAVIGLGALGVVTALDLRVQPSYRMAQTVWDGLGWDTLCERFDEIMAAAYSVGIFTSWRQRSQIWVKQRCDDGAPDLSWTGARPADGARHPMPWLDPSNCTDQGGLPGPWFARLPHFRAGVTASTGAELQSEFLVASVDAVGALRAIRAIADQIAPVLQASEIRTIAADDLWMSPAYRRDSVGIHFTWKPDAAAVFAVLTDVQRALVPFTPRAHWGKLIAGDRGTGAQSFERLGDFARLASRWDPDGKFRNDFMRGLGCWA